MSSQTTEKINIGSKWVPKGYSEIEGDKTPDKADVTVYTITAVNEAEVKYRMDYPGNFQPMKVYSESTERFLKTSRLKR